MKIAFVTPYYKPSVGGVQNYVEDLVKAYKSKHEIIILTTKIDKYQPTKEHIDGVTIYRLPVLLKVSNTPYHPGWKRHMNNIFRSENPDIINAHAPVPWFGDMAQRAAGRIPFVFTYHAGSMKKGSLLTDSLIGFYESTVLKKTFHSASRLIAVYPDFIRRILNNSRQVTHIPPGIDVDFFKPHETRKNYDLVFAGRLEKSSAWKGLDTLLSTVVLLKDTVVSPSLCIAGDGDARQYYEEKVKELGISDLVTFSGSLDKHQMRALYQASKLIVLPSYTESESFGMVVAEAASCGVPAVGSNIGGIPSVIDHEKTGLLAQPKDADSFAQAISLLLTNNSLRNKYGAAARERITKLYSMQQKNNSTLNIFAEALASPYPKNIQVVAYYPPALGGMEQVAENIAVELVESNQTVEVVTSSIGYTKNFKDYKHEGYTVTRLFGIMIAGLPVTPMLLWRLLKQPIHSLYHVHVAQAFIPEFVLLAAWLRRGTFVAHFHLDVAPSGTFGGLFVIYKKTLFPLMLRKAARVIVFSKDQEQLVMHKYGVQQSRIRIIPNGIRRGFERPTSRKLNSPARLLFVGRLSVQKNVNFLLDALDGISEKVSTRIVGEGELRHDLEQQARRLNLHNVTFVGRKDGDELRNEYNQADIFVLPSEREGMPLVLIDAMAMRLPAIGSNVLGIRDVIRDETTGLLVPLDNTAALQKAILRLSSSAKTYATMSEASYDAVRELTWPRLTQRLVQEVYP